VAHLLGFMKREKRLEVEKPPRSSSFMGRLSTEMEEAAPTEAARLKFEKVFADCTYSRSTERLLPRPCFATLRGGGA